MNWKANLMRWQMVWDASFDDRNNLTTYDNWLAFKLNETDYLLAACIKYQTILNQKEREKEKRNKKLN